MEVRSEPGAMLSREPFSSSLQQNHLPLQSSSQNMRIVFSSDGTAMYKPVTTTSSPYQGSAGTGVSDCASQPIGQHGIIMNTGETVKRKRGRPRKYEPDGSMASGVSPASVVSPFSVGFSSTPAGTPVNHVSQPSASLSAATIKKPRGRPPGSTNKPQMGNLGIGFTPHILTVQAGEDISSKIMSFTQCGSRAVCILSANGAISNVTLYQAATSGGTVTYEGRFEILSLSGSFLLSESGGQRSRTGGLSVSMAGADGRVLGGGVAGLLVAASPVQVVLGSFVADGRKESKQRNPSETTSHTKLPPGSDMGLGSPPSHGTLSESSGPASSA